MARVMVGCGATLANSSSQLSSSPPRNSFLGETLPRCCIKVLKGNSQISEQAPVCARASLSESPPRPCNADPFSTLGLNETASKSEVKSVYRRLALQYHPDVCVGDNCSMMFTQINQAYEKVMNCLHMAGDQEAAEDCLEGFYGMGDESWDEWEEWMGWEGASGVQDYSTHINVNV